MTTTMRSPDEVLMAPRIPDLCRQVWAYAGLPVGGASPTGDRFVIRSGPEPEEWLAKVLQEAFAEDVPDIVPFEEGLDPEALPPDRVVVREGFDAPCPIGQELEEVASPGRPLTFAVERRDRLGRMRSVTWVVLSEELLLQEVPLTAAVARDTFDDEDDPPVRG
jgi:hypothetical protein